MHVTHRIWGVICGWPVATKHDREEAQSLF